MSKKAHKTNEGKTFAPILKKYERFGITAPNTPIEHDEYIAYLYSIQKYIPKLEMRIFPALFDPTASEALAFPRQSTWRWSTLGEQLHYTGALGVLVRIPLFWQVEPLIFHACHESGAFLFLNDPDNMPVGRVAIQSANINTVLTTSEDAEIFSKYLYEHDVAMPKNWFIVYSASDKYFKIPFHLMEDSSTQIAKEIHIFPGIPIFFQCANLSSNRNMNFHLVDGYQLEIYPEKNSPLISGTEYDALPLIKYKLTYMIEKAKNTCECGGEIYQIRV